MIMHREEETFENPFRTPGRWVRGNLHTHSTRSDGLLEPRDVTQWYWNNGYDILALTEHDVFSREDLQLVAPDKLLLPAVEVTWMPGPSKMHVLIFGAMSSIETLLATVEGSARSWEDLEAFLKAAHELHVVSVIAHPTWSKLDRKVLLELEYDCVEIYTHCAELETGTGYSVDYWDDILKNGQNKGGLAVDDAHAELPDLGGGWINMRIADLSTDAVLKALRGHLFYASSGPQILDFDVIDGEATVQTSDVQRISFITEQGKVSECRQQMPTTLNNCSFQLPQSTMYVRMECEDDSGRKAWTNPIRVKTKLGTPP